jgi:hypothetical protein
VKRFKSSVRIVWEIHYIVIKVKGKVVPVLLIEHHAMNAYGGVEVQLHALKTSALHGVVVSFTLRPLYPQGKVPDTHWIGGWVDPRAGLD